MSQRYLSEVSELEVKYILSAFGRLIFRLPHNNELCSHSHESHFLNQHNSSIREKDKIWSRSIPLVNSLNKTFEDITNNDPLLKNLIIEFKNYTKFQYKSEMILWCAWLLANYHKKRECSEFLTLALKFKLVAYFEFVEYTCCHKVPPASVMKIMVEFLRYISLYKCEKVLFISYLNAFMEYNEFDFDDDDYLQPFLPQVLDAAHEIRFNFFRFWYKESILMERKYIQKSVLENLERYLILVKYGYQDQRYSRAFYYYDVYIRIYDLDNLFGFLKRVVRRRSNKKYRPYQVLHLYIQAYYDEKYFGQEFYDGILRILWQSIPDPFLSQTQFLSSFEQSDKFPEFLKVWKWYAKIVLNDVESVKAPRSLKHLTRCAIRQILTESVQMPFGIESLSIPSTLKSYLRLEQDELWKKWVYRHFHLLMHQEV